MKSLFSLKNPKDSIQILAFRHHALDYSISVLENKKKSLRSNARLRAKIENYLLMERLAIKVALNNSPLSFDIKKEISLYLNNPNNVDLKNYMNICNHIVAKKLDINELYSRVQLNGNYFVVEGKDLIGVDCVLTTVGFEYSDLEKSFLIGCARKSKKIIKKSTGSSSNMLPVHAVSNNSSNNNLLRVA